MTPTELAAILRLLELTQREAAERLGIDHSTLWRYLHGQQPIPGPVAAAVRAWRALHQEKVTP